MVRISALIRVGVAAIALALIVGGPLTSASAGNHWPAVIDELGRVPHDQAAPDADAETRAKVAEDPDRPLLAIPFPCEETWRGAAWTGHNPANAIDFNLWGTDGDDDLGMPVITSAAGTVLATHDYGDGYGWAILIDHGSGYRTFYAHLQEESWQVQEGDQVAANQMIARVGKSGGQEAAHLHYEQRNYDSVIPILFGTSTWVEYPSVEPYTRINNC